MNRNLEILEQSFKENDLAYTAHEEDHLLSASFRLRNVAVHFTAHAPPEENQVVIQVFVPIAIPAQRRSAVGELLHRANQILKTGSYGLDYNDGEVRFTTCGFTGSDSSIASDEFAERMRVALVTVDALCPALMKVGFSNVSPQHALEQAEAALDDYLEDHNRHAD